MLLQRKSLAFVAPSGEEYLIFMLLKVRDKLLFHLQKNYQNSLKRVLLRRKKLHWPRLIWPTRYSLPYLVSDLDEQEEDNKNEQVVKDANSSDDDEDDLESKLIDVCQIQRQIVRRRRDVIPDVTRQRCVLHRCRQSSQSTVSATY